MREYILLKIIVFNCLQKDEFLGIFKLYNLMALS